MKPFLLWSCAAIAGVALSSIGFSPARAEDKRPAPPAVRHADARQAAELVATNAVIVLDVRTPREFAAGHIAGATNLNYLGGDFSDRLAQLDPSKTYLLHCAVGGRSTNALPKMARLGFTNLIHLDGGFKAWQAAGNPVVRP
jgi:rhodanese-related sulfurtransferase